jgi:hypothetical protein
VGSNSKCSYQGIPNLGVYENCFITCLTLMELHLGLVGKHDM